MKLEKITSFGLCESEAYIKKPKTYSEIQEIIHEANKVGLKICVRGSGLSFSNVCIIDKNIVLDITSLNKIIEFNLQEKYIIVQSGIKTVEVLSKIMPYNFSLAGLSGSKNNTVGGDIGCDVNGKDSWSKGNFGANVEEMKVLLASGEIKMITKNDNLFYGIIGGLGLLGIILEVKLKLEPIKSSLISTQSYKCKSLQEQIKLFESLEEQKEDFAFSWTDSFASNKRLGRGIVETAYFQNSDELIPFVDIKEKEKIFGISSKKFWAIMRKMYGKNAHHVASVMKYNFSRNNSKKDEISFQNFQYPMTKFFPDWNLLFYPKGFREIQFLFPFTTFEKAFREIMGICKEYKIPPYTCSIKKHKPQKSLLSFANDGLSFTVNFGLKGLSQKELCKIEKKFIENCLLNKGKIYLGKFPFIESSYLLTMYPDYWKFKNLKEQYDKNNLFWSDAADILLT